ncbi:response regulator transcription factor [Sulfurimonas autotrophica]|uniref:Response regulator receiver protein n=1 Tax=Sulfurimonas autotrophica (strain ATCC BAA-671 / DSM 16294 / JCM 11897 / OK10) TaxID=563040 RepID=E0USG1_SULAO|nr:response regulator transcription factor [Sulfurimonas autotrophica]ADN09124.1 response regulator receiver protein [Sulfurimonas autotrophica DSM 16294]
MSNKILLVEDDEILSETLIELLENEAFEVLHVKDGEAALDATFENKFTLLLLDVNVPLLNGFEFLKSLRESGDMTPAIFLTSLSDLASLANGFDVGADDYIKKPFDFDELLIRIHALLKKAYHTYQNELRVNNFRFVIDKDELYNKSNFIALSPYELQITKLFFKNLNKTVQKELIFEELSANKEMSEGALRVHINKLRKIGLPITTIKGIGYRLASS